MDYWINYRMAFCDFRGSYPPDVKFLGGRGLISKLCCGAGLGNFPLLQARPWGCSRSRGIPFLKAGGKRVLW